jgi:hypothetical protein
MSIYPVPLQKWFPNPKHNRKHRNWKSYEDSLSDYENLRIIVKLERCYNCGKHCKYNRAWGHHSLSVGYGDVWCSEKCLYGPKKRKRKHMVKKLRGYRNKVFTQWGKEMDQQMKLDKIKFQEVK